MPTDTSSMELRQNSEQDVQDILRGIDALYTTPDTIAVPETPSLFDKSEETKAEIAVIDFYATAQQIVENPRSNTDTVVRIGEGITHLREYFANAA